MPSEFEFSVCLLRVTTSLVMLVSVVPRRPPFDHVEAPLSAADGLTVVADETMVLPPERVTAPEVEDGAHRGTRSPKARSRRRAPEPKWTD